MFIANPPQRARIRIYRGRIQQGVQRESSLPHRITFALKLREALFGLNPTEVYLMDHLAS
jgi:hypothetical protein